MKQLPFEERKGIFYQVPRWLLALVAGLAPVIVTFGLISGCGLRAGVGFTSGQRDLLVSYIVAASMGDIINSKW
jgi:hypothetical protein